MDGHYISCTRLLHALCTVIAKGWVYVEKKDQSAVLSVSSPERSPVICFTNILTKDDIVPGLEQRLREMIEIQLGHRILFTTVFVDTRLWKTKH